jgi:putative tricarboxylic transport membrane protein
MSKNMENPHASRLLSPQTLLRKDVLTGLLFLAVAAFGLWLSRNYPMGTTLRMGTGYMPRLLCWVLLGLGGLVILQSLFVAGDEEDARVSTAGAWRPVVFVTAALVLFALSLESLGLVVAIALLTGVGALAGGGLRVVETVIAGVALIVLAWAVFILGLGITVPVWPEW